VGRQISRKREKERERRKFVGGGGGGGGGGGAEWGSQAFAANLRAVNAMQESRWYDRWGSRAHTLFS